MLLVKVCELSSQTAYGTLVIKGITSAALRNKNIFLYFHVNHIDHNPAKTFCLWHAALIFPLKAAASFQGDLVG